MILSYLISEKSPMILNALTKKMVLMRKKALKAGINVFA